MINRTAALARIVYLAQELPDEALAMHCDAVERTHADLAAAGKLRRLDAASLAEEQGRREEAYTLKHPGPCTCGGKGLGLNGYHYPFASGCLRDVMADEPPRRP